jgi:hypothetical protein
VVSREQARQLALALPEAVELDHHGRPSFRVAGKIFATQRDDEHMNVMLDEGGIRAAVQREPGTFEECGGGSGSPRSAWISASSRRTRSRPFSRRPGS